MTVDEATQIISAMPGRTEDHPIIYSDGGLYSLRAYLWWEPGDKDATLDGEFSADQLEAIAVLMRAA